MKIGICRKEKEDFIPKHREIQDIMKELSQKLLDFL